MLFPATPKLGPIYQDITHYVPLDFPLLLIVPAFAIDLTWQRVRDRPWWLASIALGTAFLVGLLVGAVAIRRSDDAARPELVLPRRQLRVLATEEHRGVQLFASVIRGPVIRRSSRGLAQALGFAIVTSAVGRAWGRWMTRVSADVACLGSSDSLAARDSDDGRAARGARRQPRCLLRRAKPARTPIDVVIRPPQVVPGHRRDSRARSRRRSPTRDGAAGVLARRSQGRAEGRRGDSGWRARRAVHRQALADGRRLVQRARLRRAERPAMASPSFPSPRSRRVS